MKRLHHGDIMALDNQIAGNGQTGGAGTYHGNLFTGGLGLWGQLAGTVFPFPIRDKAF